MCLQNQTFSTIWVLCGEGRHSLWSHHYHAQSGFKLRELCPRALSLRFLPLVSEN